MSGQIADRTNEVLYEIAKEYGFGIIALEVMSDHIHILIEAPPKYAPSKIVGYLKGISSRKLRQEFPDLIRRHIWKENTLWARGYYIASLADGVTTGIVREYINNQKMERISEADYVQGKLF